jgi:hypothetical protein
VDHLRAVASRRRRAPGCSRGYQVGRWEHGSIRLCQVCACRTQNRDRQGAARTGRQVSLLGLSAWRP